MAVKLDSVSLYAKVTESSTISNSRDHVHICIYSPPSFVPMVAATAP